MMWSFIFAAAHCWTSRLSGGLFFQLSCDFQDGQSSPKHILVCKFKNPLNRLFSTSVQTSEAFFFQSDLFFLGDRWMASKGRKSASKGWKKPSDLDPSEAKVLFLIKRTFFWFLAVRPTVRPTVRLAVRPSGWPSAQPTRLTPGCDAGWC